MGKEKLSKPVQKYEQPIVEIKEMLVENGFAESNISGGTLPNMPDEEW